MFGRIDKRMGTMHYPCFGKRSDKGMQGRLFNYSKSRKEGWSWGIFPRAPRPFRLGRCYVAEDSCLGRIFRIVFLPTFALEVALVKKNFFTSSGNLLKSYSQDWIHEYHQAIYIYPSESKSGNRRHYVSFQEHRQLACTLFLVKWQKHLDRLC